MASEHTSLLPAFRRAVFDWLVKQGRTEQEAREIINGLYAKAQSKTYGDWGRVG